MTSVTNTGALERILRARGLFDIVQATAHAHHVTVPEILGRDRHKTIAEARAALYVALRRTGLSYPQIGRLLDRDHTTVLAGVKKCGDPLVRVRVEEGAA